MRKQTKALSFKIFLALLVSLALIAGYSYSNFRLNSSVEKPTEALTETINQNKAVTCSRTTRLSNKPPYDRALSLIEEKYKLWESTGEKIGIWYFFPSQLVNCIQVIEGDVKNTSGTEGFFIFNDSEIKEDYFPITVGKDYSYADDSVNSLILVHEITHVYQYLNSINNQDDLSCIDKEVEAFYAQWKFYGIQFPEARKSIDYRIENDTELHPQLKMIKAIKAGMSLDGVRSECLSASSKNDPNCIDNYRKNEIKEMLLQDAYYKKQCGI